MRTALILAVATAACAQPRRDPADVPGANVRRSPDATHASVKRNITRAKTRWKRQVELIKTGAGQARKSRLAMIRGKQTQHACGFIFATAPGLDQLVEEQHSFRSELREALLQ